MINGKKIIPVKLSNGAVVAIEAKCIPAETEEEERDVALGFPSFKEVTNVIKGVAQEIADALKEVKPTKAIVEFGLDAGFKSGKLVVIVAEGSIKSNLKITLEWSGQAVNSLSP